MPIPYILIEQDPPPKSGRDEKIVYARTLIRDRVGTGRIARDITSFSTVSTGDLVAALHGLAHVLRKELVKGHKVELEGVGRFSVSARTGALDDPQKLRSAHFHRRRIEFEPDPELLLTLDKLTFVRKK